VPSNPILPFASSYTVPRKVLDSTDDRKRIAQSCQSYGGKSNSQKLLLDTNVSLAIIANQVGYESLASFSKAFKRTVILFKLYLSDHNN